MASAKKHQSIQLWPSDLAKLVSDALQNSGFSDLAENAKKELYGPDVMIKLPSPTKANVLSACKRKDKNETFFDRCPSPAFDPKCSTRLNLLEFTAINQSAMLSDTFFSIPQKVIRNEESVQQKDMIQFESICQPKDDGKLSDDHSIASTVTQRQHQIKRRI